MTYGYIRVSSRDQNEARQVDAMRAFGIPDGRMVIEKQSGRDFNRPLYRALVRRLREGDVLVIKSIDRLGRDYEEILAQWKYLTREKRADIVVLDMPLLDTRAGRDLTGRLISDIVLELLSYVAQTERELIRQRQAEGIAAARERGVRWGRPPMELPDNFGEVFRQWKDAKISGTKAAARLGVSHSTFYRWAENELKKEAGS